MKVLFIEYPKCSTCQKAKKWLISNNIDFADRHIAEDTPTAEELNEFVEKSGLDIRKFFNTSGQLYRQMELKDKLGNMSRDEMLKLLSENGMLIKRPILVGEDFVTVGFKEEAYKKLFL